MDFSPFTNAPNWGNDFPKLITSINNQAHAARVPPCALAAIVKRETGGQNIFQDGMARGPGCGVGYTQITYGVDWSNVDAPTYEMNGISYALLDPSSNLYVAALGFLAPAITDMLDLRASVGMEAMPQEIIYYAFAAYNAGSYRVAQVIRGGGDPDSITTDDYAQGTLAFYHEALGSA